MLLAVKARDLERGSIVGRDWSAVRWGVSARKEKVVLVGEAWLCGCDALRVVGGIG